MTLLAAGMAHPCREAPPLTAELGNAAPRPARECPGPPRLRWNDLSHTGLLLVEKAHPTPVFHLCPLTRGKTSFHADFQQTEEPTWDLREPGHKEKGKGWGED